MPGSSGVGSGKQLLSQRACRVQVCVQASFSKGYKPERAELVSILRAGGATVLTVAQALAQGADLAILLPSKPCTDPQVLSPF